MTEGYKKKKENKFCAENYIAVVLGWIFKCCLFDSTLL